MNPNLPSDPEEDATSNEFARALEEHERAARAAAAATRAAADIVPGAKVRGKVVAVGEQHTLIDYGGRSEAVAETRQFRAEDGSLAIAAGDVLELFVIEAGDQVVLARSMRAEGQAALRQVREARAGSARSRRSRRASAPTRPSTSDERWSSS